jgi:hypothetical protein
MTLSTPLPFSDGRIWRTTRSRPESRSASLGFEMVGGKINSRDFQQLGNVVNRFAKFLDFL